MKRKRIQIHKLLRRRSNRLFVFIFLSGFIGIFHLLSSTPVEGAEAVASEQENQAQPDTSDSPALTEKQVIEFALSNSRKLESLSTSQEIAEHRYHASGLIRNPELRLTEISNRYLTDEFDELETGLRWRLPRLGELGEEKQQGRVRFWERKVDKIRYGQRLVARVRKNYATVLMYDQLAEIARQRVLKEDQRIRIIEKLVDLGSRSVVYFTKAKMWHADSKNDLARALQQQDLARRQLARRSGISENAKLLKNELPEVTQELNDLIELANQNRPEIELVQQRIELAVKQNNLERFKLIPWPTFFELSYHKEKKRANDWAELKVGINLPIFNWNLGNIKATNLAVKKKEDESDAIYESIEEEVRSAFIIYKDLLLDWKNFEVNARELISNAEQIINNAKLHETLMPDEVFEMELTILDTQKLLVEKRRDLAHALIELYFAIGIENHEQLGN